MSLTLETIRRLPKAELHVHLDGSIRPATMIELAREHGVELPADDPEALAKAIYVRHAKNLEEYLERYYTTVAVMQTPKAMERIAYEFIHDLAAENVRYVEVRYCPALHAPAMTLTEAVEAPLAGLKRAEKETGTIARLIIAALRTLPSSVSADLARVAVDYSDDGVIAFDLAGAERGHPARAHVDAFDHAHAHGLACTCHAGEGDGPESIADALHVCGAQRIGHGTNLFRDPDLEQYVIEQRVPLEICLTSNVHTHTVDALDQHPVRRYLDLGCVVTLNTDSRLIDGITLSDEYWLAHAEFELTRSDIETLILNTFESAFLPDGQRAQLIAQAKREFEEIP